MTDMRRHITEYLTADLESGRWMCARCEADLTALDDNYKRGCRVRVRDPREIHHPGNADLEYNLAPDPEWCQLIEFYCPNCFGMIEVEYLPPGFPVLHDIELDVSALRERAVASMSGPEERS